MKIIQTYWNAKGENFDQAKCGWLTPETHWMAWALSCTLLRRFYDDVELYTTEKDAEIFRKFNIPYTKIHTSLDCDFIRNLDSSMWAYAKIYTYSLQEEPFLHVDGDVFIWEAFNKSLFSGDICVQNVEENLEVYHKSIETLFNTEGAFIPEWIYENKDYPIAYNMGIFGSNNIPFVKEYCNIAFDYYEKNKSLFSQMHQIDPNVNILPEQYLLYILSVKKNISAFLLHNKSVKRDHDFSAFCDFTKIPKRHYFLHTLGSCKKNPMVNEFISHCLSLENKHCYNIIDGSVPSNIELKYEDIFFNNFIKTLTSNNDKSQILIKVTNELNRLEEELNNAGFIQFSKCTQLFPFPHYKQTNLDTHRIKGLYIGANPNHKIARTNFNFMDIARNDYILTEENTQPTILFLIRFYNASGRIIKSTWFTPIELQLFEAIKSGAYTIESLVANLDTKNKESVLDLIEVMYNEELIYFCKTKDSLIKQDYSSAYSIFVEDYRNTLPIVIKQFIERKDLPQFNPFSLNIYGNSVFDLINVLRSHGITAKAYQCEKNIPDECKLPFISLINIWQTLPIYVVIVNVTEKYIVLYNPISKTEEQHLKSTFYSFWSKYIITT